MRPDVEVKVSIKPKFTVWTFLFALCAFFACIASFTDVEVSTHSR